MAQVFTNVGAPTRSPQVEGALRQVFGNWTPTDNYTTGGMVVSPAIFGLTRVHFIVIGTAQGGTREGTYSLGSTPAEPGLIQLFTSSTGSEVAAGASAAADVYSVMVFGV